MLELCDRLVQWEEQLVISAGQSKLMLWVNDPCTNSAQSTLIRHCFRVKLCQQLLQDLGMCCYIAKWHINNRPAWQLGTATLARIREVSADLFASLSAQLAHVRHQLSNLDMQLIMHHPDIYNALKPLLTAALRFYPATLPPEHDILEAIAESDAHHAGFQTQNGLDLFNMRAATMMLLAALSTNSSVVSELLLYPDDAVIRWSDHADAVTVTYWLFEYVRI